MHMFWIDTRQSGVKVTSMPKMGVGAPWGCIEMTDVRVPAALVNDMSFLVKDRKLANISGAGNCVHALHHRDVARNRRWSVGEDRCVST